MNIRPLRFLAPLLCGLALVVTTSSAAAPISDIAGEYTGKFKNKIKVVDVEGDTESATETYRAGMVIQQEGVSINVDLVLFVTDLGEEEDVYFECTGAAGNGNIHIYSEGLDGRLFLYGTMKGNPGKRSIKLKGAFVDDEHIADFKVSLKEGDSGIIL